MDGRCAPGPINTLKNAQVALLSRRGRPRDYGLACDARAVYSELDIWRDRAGDSSVQPAKPDCTETWEGKSEIRYATGGAGSHGDLGEMLHPEILHATGLRRAQSSRGAGSEGDLGKCLRSTRGEFFRSAGGEDDGGN
jgi:hypothetical protein